MMMESQVNRSMARDLVSNAGSARVADDTVSAADFERAKARLNGQESDLRSLPSEYDYGSKRKFLDVLGNVSISQKLKQIRAQQELMNMSKANGSVKSGMSKKSQVSRRTEYSRAQAPAPIDELLDDEDDQSEAVPEDFTNCRKCGTELTEDEKIINARLVNEAMVAGRDTSMFPLRLECFMESLGKVQQNKRDTNEKKYSNMKESKGVFFPSNKRIFDANMFQCSEDFKQLGTLHHENRAAEYYPLEKP